MPTSSQITAQSQTVLDALSVGFTINPVFFIGLTTLFLLSIGYILFGYYTGGKGD